MKKNPSAKKTAAALAATGFLSLTAIPAASAAMSANPCSPGTGMQQSGACGAKTSGATNPMYKKKNPCTAKNSSAAKMTNPCSAKKTGSAG